MHPGAFVFFRPEPWSVKAKIHPRCTSARRKPAGGELGQYVLRRVLQMVPTLAGVVLLVFVLFHWVAPDPVQVLAGQHASPERIELIRAQLGLDRPYTVQLAIFVRQIASFDFGRSWTSGEDVGQIFATRLPASMTILVPILVLEIVIGTLLALAIASIRGSLTDRSVMVACNTAMSVSLLIYVIVFQWLFAYKLGWFPVQGWSDDLSTNLVRYAPLPIALGVLTGLAPTLRTFRTFMLSEYGHDYVRTARARGAGEARVLLAHVLRNALIPILAYVSLALPSVFVGSFLLEVFFSIPGIGRELVTAVNRGDFPVIKASVVYLAMLTMTINLATDLAFRAVDPRVRIG
jgi:peptide/nickel transport system permease protein